MIINNYNNTLPENKESNLTFTSLADPIIGIRMFDFNLVQGETHLVVNYWVSDYKQSDYINEKVGPTFTTVVTVDEDTVPANEVRTWKKTTYAGEQFIDLGTFDELGIHTLNIRTIQSNGIGSITKMLKFIVRKPESQMNVIDLSNGGSFISEFNGYTQYKMRTYPNDVVAYEFNCKYSVVCETDSSNNVTGITISVGRRVQNKKCITVYNVTDEIGTKGEEYVSRTDDYADGCNTAWDANNAYPREFHLSTSCLFNGEDTELTEFLQVTAPQLLDNSSSNPYRIVIETAAKNKLALMRLFEAAKAAGADRIKLPNMDIVCSYHYAKDYSTDTSLSLDVSEGYNDKTITRDGIIIPNGFWVDLNGSHVSVLQTNRNWKASLFPLAYCIDAHLTNGKISGNWIGTTHSNPNDGESRNILKMQACQFCSFEGLDISGTVGYDVMVAPLEGTIGVWSNPGKAFNKKGYIDYDGVEHDGESVTDGELYHGFMYTDDMKSITNTHWCVDNHVIRIATEDDGGYSVSGLHSLTCRTVLASFYDANNNFIKTVKTYERFPTLTPYGATKIRLCKYGTALRGEMDSVNTGNSTVRGRFGVCYRITLGWGCVIRNCNIYNTRQVVFANGSAQTLTQNCKLFCVNGERQSHYSWSVNSQTNEFQTPTEYAGVIRSRNEVGDPRFSYDFYSIYPTWIVDIEDESRQLYYGFWDNVEVVCGRVNSIQLDAGYDYHFKDCKNLHINFNKETYDCLVENCYGSVAKGYSWMTSGSTFIVRNSILTNIENGNAGFSSRGTQSGDIYLRNNDVIKLYTDVSHNNLIHNYKKLKM
jgi:hypothetical protein